MNVALFVVFCLWTVTRARPPNILLIVADDLGFGDLGFRGTEIKTPTIDELATKGVILEQHYVQPVCTPTRSSLMTGRYPIHNGMQHYVILLNEPHGVPLDETFLPQRLKQCGYETHAIGKWHLGFYKREYTPCYRGFDTFFGYYQGSEDYFTHYSGMNITGWGLDLRRDRRLPNSTVESDLIWNADHVYSAQLFTNEFERVLSAYDGTRPFFMYLALQSVHAPQEVPQHYVDPYKHIPDLNRRRYAGMVAALDETVLNVTAMLKKSGVWNDTLVVFTSDNGGPIAGCSDGIGARNCPLRGGKHSLWEGGIRSNAFVYGAGLDVVGYRNWGLMHVTDWLPTLLHVASEGRDDGGAELELDGVNQWEMISQNGSSNRREILHNIDPLLTEKILCGVHHGNHSALRVGDYKLLVGDPGPPDSGCQGNSSWHPTSVSHYLFNIKEDPNEEIELSTKEPDVLTAMLSRMQYYASTAVPPGNKPRDVHANPQYHNGTWVPWDD